MYVNFNIILTYVVILRSGEGLVDESLLQQPVLKAIDPCDVVERVGFEGRLEPFF